MYGHFTMAQAHAMADVLRAAQGNMKVARIDPTDPEGKRVLRGVAQRMCAVDGALYHREMDVRDLFLEVMIVDSAARLVHWSVWELLQQHAADSFIVG